MGGVLTRCALTRPSLCLINPPHPYLTQPKAQAPLGLLYIAASVRKKGYPVSYLDLSDRKVADITPKDIPEADIYGLTGTMLDAEACNLMAWKLKENDPKCKVIIGGPVTITSHLINDKYIDSIVSGEGEFVIFDVLDDYPNVKPLYMAKRILNLDTVPFPARDLIDGKLGGDVFVGRKSHYGNESTVFCTSRGCPFNCAFCASPYIWNRKVTYRSAHNIALEMMDVVEKFGVRQFRFSDDNLTTDVKRLYDLCDRMKGWDIAWRASIRVRPRMLKMFKKMKEAGCVEVCFGIESFDDTVLMVLNKSAKSWENVEAIENAKAAGLDVRVLMMTGTPGESVATTDINIKYLEKLKGKFDALAVTNFAPLPGTAVAKDPFKHRCEIMNEDVENMNLCLYGPEGMNEWKTLIRPFGMTIEELEKSKAKMLEYVIATGKSNHG